MQLREGTPQEAGMDAARVARLRELAATAWAPRTSALQLLAARRGVVFWHEVWGKLRPEDASATLTKEALFPVASVTKPFVATAVMMLAEEGRLDVNRPVNFYLPEFVGDGKDAVFVHQLLTHTSGIDEMVVDYQRGYFPRKPPGELDATEHPAVRRLVHLTCNTPLAYPPGKEHRYCNPNYTLLIEIVRRVTGRAPGEWLRERVFEPLGMRDSHFALPEELAPRRVRWPDAAAGAHSALNRGDPMWWSLNDDAATAIPYGFAGLTTTARDLAIFGQAFSNGGTYGGTRILKPSTVALMTKNHTAGLCAKWLTVDAGEMSQGYGWFLKGPGKFPFMIPCLASPGSYGHAGFGGASLWVDPAQELVLVYLSTQSESATWGVLWDFDLFANALTSAVAD
jgi:CubicO group peptidase (beta-lactamase class C family)